MNKGDYILFKDSFNITHVGLITSTSNDEIGVLVVKSIEESNLNTATISEENIEMIFEGKPDLENLEINYPEIWI